MLSADQLVSLGVRPGGYRWRGQDWPEPDPTFDPNPNNLPDVKPRAERKAPTFTCGAPTKWDGYFCKTGVSFSGERCHRHR